MTQRRWKIGSTEVEVFAGREQPDGKTAPATATDTFRRVPGSLDDSTATSVIPTEPEKLTLKESRALWNQPLRRQLLFLPALVAFVWWKWLGFSGWSWLVVLAAVPTTALYFRSIRRATDPDADAPHELPPLPSKYRDDN